MVHSLPIRANLFQDPARWWNNQQEEKEVDEHNREECLGPALVRAGLVVSELTSIAIAQKGIGAQNILAIDGAKKPRRNIQTGILIKCHGILLRVKHAQNTTRSRTWFGWRYEGDAPG
jgi:hypothetical protein